MTTLMARSSIAFSGSSPPVQQPAPRGAEETGLVACTLGPGVDEVRRGPADSRVVDPQPAERLQPCGPPRFPWADQTHVVAARVSRLDFLVEEKEAENVARRVVAELGMVAQLEEIDPALVSQAVLEGDQGGVQTQRVQGQTSGRGRRLGQLRVELERGGS